MMHECPPRIELCELRSHGKRLTCLVNGGDCLVDNGSPASCLRYSWVKAVQAKTAQVARLEQELKVLSSQEHTQAVFWPELPDGEAIGPQEQEI
jgi:hypothetical protein